MFDWIKKHRSIHVQSKERYKPFMGLRLTPHPSRNFPELLNFCIISKITFTVQRHSFCFAWVKQRK